MLTTETLVLELAWPFTLLVSWAAGEIGQRWLRIPRISVYATVGFLLASSQVGLLPRVPSERILLLASIAFGLILFEAGYRLNLRWLRANPWLTVTSLAESALTFGAVFWLLEVTGAAKQTALATATLAMASSPATVVRVINETKSAGQITERILHLAALNCAIAVLGLKLLLGFPQLPVGDDLWDAVGDAVLALGGAVLAGVLMGAFVPALLRMTRRTGQDGTIAYAIAVITLVAVTHSLRLSPVLATLTFGLVSRHRRVFLAQSQRGFGSLGEVLGVLLFTFVAVTLEWRHVRAGMWLGLGLIVVRQIAKLAAVGVFAYVSGTTWRKGVLTGLGLAPMSAVVLLVLEHTRAPGLDLLDGLAPLAAAALLMEIVGPILVGRALRLGDEVPESPGS